MSPASLRRSLHLTIHLAPQFSSSYVTQLNSYHFLPTTHLSSLALTHLAFAHFASLPQFTSPCFQLSAPPHNLLSVLSLRQPASLNYASHHSPTHSFSFTTDFSPDDSTALLSPEQPPSWSAFLSPRTSCSHMRRLASECKLRFTLGKCRMAVGQSIVGLLLPSSRLQEHAV